MLSGGGAGNSAQKQYRYATFKIQKKTTFTDLKIIALTQLLEQHDELLYQVLKLQMIPGISPDGPKV